MRIAINPAMASKVPFIKSEVSWIAVIIKILVFALVGYLFYRIDSKNYLTYTFICYLALSYGLRAAVPRSHRKGVQLIKQENFAEAIPWFQKSAVFFGKHAWVDKYRYLTMFIESKQTMREIALCNMAWCFMQTRRINESKKIYEQVLAEYPDNTVARSSLHTIDSFGYHEQGNNNYPFSAN